MLSPGSRLSWSVREGVSVIDTCCPPAPPAGEKMNEAEIDALMAGQEDENGCVNYEGKPSIRLGMCVSIK